MRAITSKGDRRANHARFLTYLLLFMTSMLGVVLAGDVITLFIFWEGTSITSFLLVAYKTKDEAARRGAFKALFITGGGGIALLAGLLFVARSRGAADFADHPVQRRRAAQQRDLPGRCCCWSPSARSPRARSSPPTSGCRMP